LIGSLAFFLFQSTTGWAPAGLLVRIFWPSESQKEALIGAVIVFLTILGFVSLYEKYQHERLIERVSMDVVSIIGNDTKTFEQINEALFKAAYTDASEAIDRLVTTGRVGHTLLDLQDTYGNRYRVRGYYVRSP
jgi:hypothetical protein